MNIGIKNGTTRIKLDVAERRKLVATKEILMALGAYDMQAVDAATTLNAIIASIDGNGVYEMNLRGNEPETDEGLV